MVRLRRMAPEVYDPTGLAPIGERQLRCIDPSHDEPCQFCAAPPAMGEDSFWSLRGDPGKRNGDKKLRTLIQMTREWNSPLERAHLVHHLQNSPDMKHMSKIIEIVRRKETPRLSKVCMMVLARAWGFKSDIWTRKCFSQPFYQNQPSLHKLNGSLMPQLNGPSQLGERGPFAGGADGLGGSAAAASASAAMAKIEGRGSASGASFSGVGMKRDISSAGAGLGSGSSLSFGGLDPSSNTLQSFPPNPKMAKMVKEAQDKRDKIERSVIAKFTPDLESARTLIEKVLEHASAAWQLSSPVAGASFQSSASYEQAKTYYLTAVRSTANALALIKHRCEECLSSLEQMHQYPVDVQEKSPWTYKSQLKQVDIFQTEFEEVFWAGSLTFVPEQATQFSQIHELVCCMAKYHAAVLKLCTIGKCEIANARNLTFGEYCTVAQATIKVFFVVMNEVTAKVAELMQAIGHYNSSMASAAPLTGNSQPHLNSNSTPQLSSSPASWQSTSALNVPVLSSQEMPTVGDTNTNVPDCLKLLRNLSSEIVLPRSISNEILLPFGIFNDVAPSPQNPTFTSNVNLNPTNLSH